jgi:hypothetical protein
MLVRIKTAIYRGQDTEDAVIGQDLQINAAVLAAVQKRIMSKCSTQCAIIEII